MKRCPVCQREYPDKSGFCNQDGSKLIDEVTTQVRLIIRLADGTQQEFTLKDALTTIGKAPDNVLVIVDGAISRKHSKIEARQGQYLITDLGSSNGTYVNGVRISESGAVLKNGDQIQIGRTKIEFLVQPDISQMKTVESPRVDMEPFRQTVESMPAIKPSAPSAPSGPPPSDPYRTPPPMMPPPAPPPDLQRTPIPGPPLNLNKTPAAPPTPPVPGPRANDSKADHVKFHVSMTGELVLPRPEAREKIVLDGRYELGQMVGQDASGTLYRARRLMLNDTVGVRVLRPELVGDTTAVERFRRQAQIAARIKHPNSVQVYDFGSSAEGAAYIVEEPLSGRTLRDLIREERGLSLSRVVSLMNQICGAVHAAHLNGIVLRDLTPDTIYIERSADGTEAVKIAGFGLAKVDEAFLQSQAAAGKGPQALTGPLGAFGQAQYASPEQLINRQLDARSDVYSLGVILFELLTGVLPFEAENVSDLVMMHLSAPVPDIAEFGRADLDEEVAAIINRALAKVPAERPASALQLAAELQAVAGPGGGAVSNFVAKMTGLLPFTPIVIPQKAAVPAGEEVLPSVLPEAKEEGRGAFNVVVLALMAEAFLSRLSSGMIKTAVPLYALLVFGMKITSVMAMVLIQNIVPLLLRPVFGSLADKYGKKKIFMISLTIRTVVSVLYAVASLPMLFVISLIRGVADSAKGPSASAMIADNTDEKNIAQAYSWYTTTKSTSGGIGEALAAFVLTILIAFYAGLQVVNVNVAVTDKVTKSGANAEEIVKDPSLVTVGNPLPGTESDPAAPKVIALETREMRLNQIPIESLPNVVDAAPLKKTLITIFLAATVLSFGSLILVGIFIKEKKKEKKEKKEKKDKAAGTGMLDAPPEQQPNVWSFALLGMALTAPAYMVTGEFFTILAVKLEVTAGALGWIKILAETVTPLLFGPFFGWLADRIGAGKVIALRSIANLLTSVMFWIVPSFAGTAMLGLMMGLARGIDEIGKAAFKPTWGAIAAKVSSFNLSSRGKTMGILEGGIDASDLAFPVIAGAMLQYLSLGPLMLLRAILAIFAEIYGIILMRKYKI